MLNNFKRFVIKVLIDFINFPIYFLIRTYQIYRWLIFLVQISFQKNVLAYTYYIRLVETIIKDEKLRQTYRESPTVALSHHVKSKFINVRSNFCR